MPIRRIAVACGLALATMLVAGCVEAAWDVEIHEDGSGTFEWRYTFDDAAVPFDAESDDGDDLTPHAACERFLRRFDGAGPVRPHIAAVTTRVETRHSDGVCSYASNITWSADESEDVLASLALNQGPEIRRITGGGWSFDFETRFVDEYLAAGGPLFEAVGELHPTFTLSLALPGTLVESNADTTDGSTHVWVIDLAEFEGIPKVLHAESATAGGGFLPQVIGIALFALVLALAVRYRLNKRRRDRAARW
ncbi:hypothetical protein [Candidatus Poriferisodalis sp.]|uniref:hypothetical protein n=1 Tax=Candidatus Poriferisodalis sp. TaxID=3101277 RepID=UPI003B01890C